MGQGTKLLMVMHGELETIHEQVALVDAVRREGKLNVDGSRIFIKTNWNIPLMNNLANSVLDREVVQCLSYGWPLNHDGRALSCTMRNHPSAMNFP